MADYLTTDTELTSVANAIRTKGGTSEQLVYPTGFVSAIEAIPTGGSSVSTCTMEVTNDPDVICSNFSGGAPSGTYVAVAEYAVYSGSSWLMVFVGCEGMTSLSDAQANETNASFFMNDPSAPSINGFVYGRTAFAGAFDDDFYGDIGDYISGYAGTYTATVIEF